MFHSHLVNKFPLSVHDYSQSCNHMATHIIYTKYSFSYFLHETNAGSYLGIICTISSHNSHLPPCFNKVENIYSLLYFLWHYNSRLLIYFLNGKWSETKNVEPKTEYRKSTKLRTWVRRERKGQWHWEKQMCKCFTLRRNISASMLLVMNEHQCLL